MSDRGGATSLVYICLNSPRRVLFIHSSDLHVSLRSKYQLSIVKCQVGMENVIKYRVCEAMRHIRRHAVDGRANGGRR